MKQLKSLTAELDAHCQAGHFSHWSLAWGRLGGETYFQGDLEVCYDLASLTKALVTTPLIFQHNLDLQLREWLGQGSELLAQLAPQYSSLRLRDLLSHKAGLPHWRPLWLFMPASTPRAQVLARFNYESLGYPRRYGDLSFILLGLALEEFSGLSLAGNFKALRRHLGGGGQLGFKVSGPYAPTHSALRGSLKAGEVHDDNAAFLGGECGHAGVFGDVKGLVSFLERLSLSALGRKVLRVNSELRGSGVEGLYPLCGWQQGTGPGAELFGRGQAIGHLGFTGTAFWVLPETLDYGVFLCNRVVSDWSGISGLRRKVFQILGSLCVNS